VIVELDTVLKGKTSSYAGWHCGSVTLAMKKIISLNQAFNSFDLQGKKAHMCRAAQNKN
jgi:hypothetical protein